MKHLRLWHAWIALITAVVVGGVVYGVLEGIPLLDGIWWASTTAPTVGYGDISPSTLLGRLFYLVFVAFTVYIITPAIIGLVVGKILYNPDAWTHHEQEELLEKMENIQLMLLETARDNPDLYAKMLHIVERKDRA